MKTRIKEINVKYIIDESLSYSEPSKFIAQIKYKYWPFWRDLSLHYNYEDSKNDIIKFLGNKVTNTNYHIIK